MLLRTFISEDELCSTDWLFSDARQRPLFRRDHLLLMEDYPPFPELISTSKAKVPKDSGALNDGEVLKAAIASFHFGMDPNQRVVDLKGFGFEKCWFRKVLVSKSVGL